MLIKFFLLSLYALICLDLLLRLLTSYCSGYKTGYSGIAVVFRGKKDITCPLFSMSYRCPVDRWSLIN